MSQREYYRMGALTILWPSSALGPIFLPYRERIKKKKIGSAEFGSEKLGYEEAIWNTSQMKIKN